MNAYELSRIIMGYGVDYTPEQLAAAKAILRRPKLLKQLYPPEILALAKVLTQEDEDWFNSFCCSR